MEIRKRLKFLVLFYPNRSPGQVYRLEAYLKYLPRKAYDYDWIINREDEPAFYKGGISQKLMLFIKCSTKRFFRLIKGNYDNVIMNREAFPLGTIFFEFLVKKILRKKIIYDFDDAIWLPVISDGNKKFAFLKSYSKFSKIIKLSDVVIAGNEYLADYARQFNSNVHIIPSCIDLDLNIPNRQKQNENDKICIGWSGSETTLAHLLLIKDVLVSIQKKYGDQVYFKVISSRNDFEIPGVNIKSVKWQKETEAEELDEFDIGIMPLPDNDWSKGKCSMKGIQYMGLAIPAVMSNIGMNKEVIEHNINGMLADTESDWIQALSSLIENEEMRRKLGDAGRQTVEKKYSIQAWKDKWLELVTS
jgi:glycosyltransferase involved in cell wall biosynthesis